MDDAVPRPGYKRPLSIHHVYALPAENQLRDLRAEPPGDLVCSVDIDHHAEMACIDHRDRWGTLWWDFLLLLLLLLYPLLLRDRLLSLLPLLLLLLLAPLTSRIPRSRHHGSIPLPTR